MSIVFFSPGNISDFEESVSAVASVSNTYTRGNHSICVIGTYGVTSYLRKTVPSAAEYYAAVYIAYNAVTSVDQSYMITFYNGATQLAKVARTGTLLQAIQDTATILGSTPANSYNDSGADMLVEVHYKRHATAGVFQIWINGVLSLDYAGNTGAQANIDKIQFGVFKGVSLTPYYSDFIIDNDTHIGDKKITITGPTAAGSKAEWDCSPVHFGHTYNSAHNASTAVSTSYVLSVPAPISGSVDKIVITGSATGNMKVFAMYQNANGTWAARAGAITLPVTVATNITFIGGVDYTAFTVTEGDRLGIYLDSTAKLKYYQAASLEIDGTANWLSTAADISAATAQALSTTAIYSMCCSAWITPTDNNSSFAVLNKAPYITSTDLDWIETNTVNEIATFTNRALTDYAIGQIDAVKTTVRIRKEGSPAVNNIQPVVVCGGTEYIGDSAALAITYSNISTLYATNPATGLAWTLAELNAANFGVKSVT